MWKRKSLYAALVATVLSSVPMIASADRVIVVDQAPPAPREEVIPAPRHGFAWIPGYWDWRGHHHVWVRGHYERERHGKYWHPSRWEQRDGRWALEKGHWDRERYVENHRGDRDHDGVPNRYDRAPDNPHRQ